MRKKPEFEADQMACRPFVSYLRYQITGIVKCKFTIVVYCSFWGLYQVIQMMIKGFQSHFEVFALLVDIQYDWKQTLLKLISNFLTTSPFLPWPLNTLHWQLCSTCNTSATLFKFLELVRTLVISKRRYMYAAACPFFHSSVDPLKVDRPLQTAHAQKPVYR